MACVTVQDTASEMWFYGYAFVLIVNRDAKPFKEADQPQHLPWYGSWQTLEFCNRYGRLPAKAINLHAEDMQVGLESPNCGPNVDGVSALPREAEIGGPWPFQDTIRGRTIYPDDEGGRPVLDRQRDRQIDTTDQPGRCAVLEREGELAHTSHPGPWAWLAFSTVPI